MASLEAFLDAELDAVAVDVEIGDGQDSDGVRVRDVDREHFCGTSGIELEDQLALPSLGASLPILAQRISA